MKDRIAIVSVTLIVVLLAWTWFTLPSVSREATRAGLAHGAQTHERLQLLWPDFEQLSDDDRRVIAELAMRCRLHQEPLVAQHVARCLRTATAGRDSRKDRDVLARLLPPRYAVTNDAP